MLSKLKSRHKRPRANRLNESLESRILFDAATGAFAELAFVDTGVTDFQSVLDDIVSNSADPDELKVVPIGEDQAGFDAIANELNQQDAVQRVHIVADVGGAAIGLGSQMLDEANLPTFEGSIASWSDSFTTDATVTFYDGDNTGTALGQDFLSSVAGFTGTSVSAVSDAGTAASSGVSTSASSSVESVDASPAPLASELGSLGQVLGTQAVDSDIVQEYFIPVQEDHYEEFFISIGDNPNADFTSQASVVISADNTVVVYDHWEDGYEANLASPSQATTEIWGDGDLSNGVAPGHADDLLTNGDVLILDNPTGVPSDRSPSTFYVDGGDRLGSTKTVTVTRIIWEFPISGAAVDVYDVGTYGTSFVMPLGDDLFGRDYFDHLSVFVTAAADNTTVEFDLNADGVVDNTQILNQGESYHLDGGMGVAGTIDSSAPIQVVLAFGGAPFNQRMISFSAADTWANSYFNPVDSQNSFDPAHVFLFNPHDDQITIDYELGNGQTGSFTVDGKDVTEFPMPLQSGAAHFESAGDETFYAFNLIDADEASTSHDWGFSLIPESQLSYMVLSGWAQGSEDLSENGNPLWVTSIADTTLYVDFDGDPTTGALTDPRGNQYDQDFDVTRLESLLVFDNADNDQTGTRIYTVDPNVFIAAAYGQNPGNSDSGNPYLDLGTTTAPFPAPTVAKSAVVADTNGSGFADAGEVIEYTITTQNDGVIALTNVLVVDEIPSRTQYVENSTTITTYSGGSPTTISVSDDATGTAFPADDAGFMMPDIGTNERVDLTFQVRVNNGVEDTTIINTAFLSSDYGNRAATVGTAVGDQPLPNVPPEATDDSYSTPEDITLDADGSSPELEGIFLNDSDLNGDTLTLSTTPVSGPSNGSLTLNANGTFSYTPDSEFVGIDTFVYQITDGFGGSDTATVSITVLEVNRPPAADDDSFQVTEDTVLNVDNSGPTLLDILTNDSDLDDDALTVITTPVTGPANGAVVLSSDGTFVYTPDADFEGVDSFVYTATDGNGGTDTATVTISVLPANDAPSAADDSYVTPEDTVLSVDNSVEPRLDLLTNDDDIDGDDLIVITTPVTEPSNGTLVLNIDGTFDYTPDLDFSGVDSFVYQVSDGNGTTDTATVTITVQPINDAIIAVSDDYVGDEDTVLNVDNSSPTLLDILTNDVEVDGDTLTVETTPVSPPTNGTLVLNSDGTFVYTPEADFTGLDSFQYRVTDGNGSTDTATVSLAIGAINDAPVAEDDTYSTLEDTQLSVDGSGPTLLSLISNDDDLDGDTLVVQTTPEEPPENGIVTISSDGTFVYTPNANFNGVDSFTYRVVDGNGGFDTATVTINVAPVSDPPVAVADTYSTLEDTLLVVDNSEPAQLDVDSNDFDVDFDSISVIATPVVNTTHGELQLAVDGTFTYQPNPGYYGQDSFVYLLIDDTGATDTATVTIEVVSQNDDPEVKPDIVTTLVNLSVSGQVLTNDGDSDGDTLVVEAIPVEQPTNGFVVLNSDGSYSYTPDPDFVGTDSFVYRASDGEGGSATATVTIQVRADLPQNDTPLANSDTAGTLEDTPVSGNVLSNDSDPEGHGLSVATTPVALPENGSVVLSADGTFVYTPNTGFIGRDSFEYEVCDENGACDVAIVTVFVRPDDDVAANNAPDANDDAVLTLVDTPVSGSLTINDSDANGDSISASIVPVTGVTNGTLVIEPSGTFEYLPNNQFVGNDQFTYQISDGNGGTDIATVYITVMPPNQPPNAKDDINITLVNVPVSGKVLTNDFDPEGHSLFVNTTPVTDVANGTLILNEDGSYTYTPNEGFVGTDFFEYEVCDEQGVSCDTAIVTIEVSNNTPGNEGPLASNDTVVTIVDVAVSGQVLNNDGDPDGDTLLVDANSITQPDNGSVIMNADGTFTYTPASGFVGTDTFTYQACDADGSCDTATVTVTVLDSDHSEWQDTIANDDAAVTHVNVGVAGSLLTNDSHLDGGSLQLELNPIQTPSNGTVTLQPDGSFSYIPELGFIGNDQFVYEVSDGQGSRDQATVYLAILPDQNEPIAKNDINNTLPGVSVSGDVLRNDRDPDGDPLFVNETPLKLPENGTLQLNQDGTYTYTPNEGFIGTDTFEYEVCDAEGESCDVALVTIEVRTNGPGNDVPVVNADAFETFVGVAVDGSLLANDGSPNGSPLTIEIEPVTSPANGAVTINEDGTFQYVPNEGFVGTDTFTYVACDASGACSEALVTIRVLADASPGVNDAPSPVDDAGFALVDAPIEGNVLTNDWDSDGDELSVDSSPVVGPVNGSLVLNADGSYTYTPNAAYIGPDSFVYKVSDSYGNHREATVYLTVYPLNLPPVAADDINDTPMNTAVFGNVTTNDSDPEGDPLIVNRRLISDPANGTVSLDADGSYVYTPNFGFVGVDSFTYEVCDAEGESCDTATVTIKVRNATDGNDAPVANNDNLTTFGGLEIQGDVLANDGDADNESLTVNADTVSQPANGTLVINEDGSFIYTPNAGFSGLDSFTYEACDAAGECDSAVVTINVIQDDNPLANDAPFAVDDAGVSSVDVPIVGNLLANDLDPESDTLTINTTPIVGPQNGTVSINADGSYTYTPNAGFSGNDLFVYEICDEFGECDVATTYLTVFANQVRFAFDSLNNFGLTDAFNADWESSLTTDWTTRPPSVSAIFSGMATPGSQLAVRLYDGASRLFVQQFVQADAAGNWLVNLQTPIGWQENYEMRMETQNWLNMSDGAASLDVQRYFHTAMQSPIFLGFDSAANTPGDMSVSSLLLTLHNLHHDPLAFGWRTEIHGFSVASTNPAAR